MGTVALGWKQQLKRIIKKAYRFSKKPWVGLSLKIFIVGILGYAIYTQVFARDNFDQLWAEFLINLKKDNLFWLILAIVLMPLNWIAETQKWLVLIRRVEKIPFFKAFKGIFLGVAFSLFTPNRVGEYGGRILVVKPENNVKTIVATLVSSFSQLMPLIGLGILGLIAFIHFRWIELDQTTFYFILFGGIASIIVMLISYYNVHWAIAIFSKIPYARRFTKDMSVLSEYSKKELSEALLYATLRYIIYSLQYYFMLRFFGVKISLFVGLAGVASIFLLQTCIPMPAIADLMVRGEVALYVWSFFTTNKISILASTFGLWFLNIIIPAMLGGIFIFSVNIVNSLGIQISEDEKDN